MSRSIQEKSLDQATATGAGTILNTGGRISISLFVVADVDPTTLDVRVEASMDGVNFAPFQDSAGNDEVTVAANDFVDVDGNGDFAAFVTAHGIAARYIRANIIDYGSAGNVDVWIAASSNPNTTKDYREVS